jgi:hypothetical protein
MSSEETNGVAAPGMVTSLKLSIAVCTKAGAQIVRPPVS